MAGLAAEDALIVLEPYFEAVQDVFRPRFRRASKVKLSVEAWAHDTERHFAATRSDGLVVICAPELALLPADNVAAVLAHEFGHVVDFLYPARFQLVDGRLVEHEDHQDGRARYNRSRQWDERGDDEVERTADAIAESVVQRPIFYSGPCVLQSFDGGLRPRPAGLR